MTRGWIGRLIECEFLPQTQLHFVGPRSLGLLAFESQAAERRLDSAGVDLVELLDVSDDFGNLRRKHSTLFGSDFQVRELGDLLYVAFINWHNHIFDLK